jgi:hypothetical protein
VELAAVDAVDVLSPDQQHVVGEPTGHLMVGREADRYWCQQRSVIE